MSDPFERLEIKIDKIAKDTADNTASLREHMQQTLEVRKQTDILTALFKSNREETERRFKPLETFKDRCIYSCHCIAYAATALYGAKELGILDFLFNIYKGH